MVTPPEDRAVPDKRGEGVEEYEDKINNILGDTNLIALNVLKQEHQNTRWLHT